MIDALFNVAVFVALVLCIFGFSAWAHKRVDAHLGREEFKITLTQQAEHAVASDYALV